MYIYTIIIVKPVHYVLAMLIWSQNTIYQSIICFWGLNYEEYNIHRSLQQSLTQCQYGEPS